VRVSGSSLVGVDTYRKRHRVVVQRDMYGHVEARGTIGIRSA
jgi:hypothetical protein